MFPCNVIRSNEPLWKHVFCCGVAPHLSVVCLETLRVALREDDPALIQGATSLPVSFEANKNRDVEAACVLGYCGWKGSGLKTVGEVEEFFAQICYDCDQSIGEPAACRHFLNWFDDTPRDQMRRLLLEEVESELNRREGKLKANPEKVLSGN